MWLTNCRVVDVRTGTVRPGSNVEIEGGVIRRIESGNHQAVSEDVNLDGLYLVPGIVSCHTHLSVVYPFSATDEDESPALTVLRAYPRARDALLAGVTTIRCVHEQHQVDLLLRQASLNGWVEVPRIVGAGRAITTTGGHGMGMGCAVADGGERFLQAARAELAAGADHIKIFITGGIAQLGESFDVAQMTHEEMAATVRAASDHHKYVVAHAGAFGAIRQALAAGVRSFEHAYLLDDETAKMMVDAGAFLTPTLCVTRSPDWMRSHKFEEWQIDKALETGPEHLASIRRAVQAGITMVNGTDYPPGEPCDGTSVAVCEMENMVTAGLSPFQSLQAATLNGAKLCRIDKKVGTIEPGMIADILAVEGDPTRDVSAMRNLRLVMQSGRVVRSPV
jgi:imidazolonepropionase-like amidohydrolase